MNTLDGAIKVAGWTAEGGVRLGPFDRIVVATGQRPDLAITRELRLDLDPWLECPKALGPAIDPTGIRVAVSPRTATMNLHTRSRDILQSV